MNAAQPEVGILMGSDSDWSTVEHAVRTLREFDIGCEARVISAHRTPEAAAEYARGAADRGIRVLIAAAGGAAHLAGAAAANTVLPVIGIPIGGGSLNGLDALLATVQMPGGVPVATVAIGTAGAVNAALLAVQILAQARPELTDQLLQHRAAMREKVQRGDARVQAECGKI